MRFHKPLCFSLLLLICLGLLGNFTPQVEASFSNPFATLNYDVLYVSGAFTNAYFGSGWIVSDLAELGFNVTIITDDVNYLEDSRTSDLSQYEIVFVQGSMTLDVAPNEVNQTELIHFCNYDGVLVVASPEAFRKFENGSWRSYDVQMAPLETRLGIDYIGTAYAEGKISTAYSVNGTFTLNEAICEGLPSYISATVYGPASKFQYYVTVNGATTVYNFAETGYAPFSGITYYENSTGAIGIWINYPIIHGQEIDGISSVLSGFLDGQYKAKPSSQGQKHTQRRALLKALLAHAFEKDYSTVLKWQPLFTWRTDDYGSTSWTDAQMVESWNNRESNITTYAPNVVWSDFFLAREAYAGSRTQIAALCKNKQNIYHLNEHIEKSLLDDETQEEIEALLSWEEGNRTALGINKAITASGHGTTIVPIRSEVSNALANYGIYYYSAGTTGWGSTWWYNMTVNNQVIWKGSTDYYTASSWAGAWYGWYSQRAKTAISAHNSWVQIFLGHIDEWRTSLSGHYDLRAYTSNITHEFPDYKYVTVDTASIYFAKNFAKLNNVARSGNTLTFDLDASKVPTVTTIGKGMVWLRINAGNTIESVKIDGSNWYVFDDYSLRIPASNSNIEVTLGTPTTPYIREADRKIPATSYASYKLNFTVNSLAGTTSITKIYCGYEGKPYTINGASSWSYNMATKIATVNVEHSSIQQVTVEWTPWVSVSESDPLLFPLLNANVIGFVIGMYTSVLGQAFYGFILLAVFGVLYNQTKSLALISIVWMLLGSVWIVAAATFSPIAVILVVAGVAGIFFSLFGKSRQ